MSLPDLFIVESLKYSDVKIGNLLANNLRSSGKNPIFMTVDGENSFKHAMKIFKTSNYRYLHIICHGNPSFISFYDEQSLSAEASETISYDSFINCFPPNLNGIRIFLAACELGNKNFSNAIMRSRHDIYSVIAPKNEILATQALYVWTTFYNQLFSSENANMKSSVMLKLLWKAVKVFNNDFHASIIHPSARERLIAHHNLLPHSTDSYKRPYDSTPIEL